MDVLNESKISDNLYNSNHNNTTSNLNAPNIPFTTFNFFINENFYNTFNEKNDKLYLPYFFKVDIENFTNLIQFDTIKDFLNSENNILNFETLKVYKFNLIHQGDVYALYDELFTLEEGKNVILDFIFNRFYLENPNEMNKIFILKNNLIVGFLMILKKEGEFLIEKIQKLNLLEKFMVNYHFLKKLNYFCNSSNIEVYDIDLRCIFISSKNENFEDLSLVNKKVYVRNFEHFTGNNSFLTKNEKFKQSLIEVFQFMCYLFDIFDFKNYNYKNAFSITIDLLEDFKIVFNNFKIPSKQKMLIFEAFKNILGSNQASLNFENEFNKIKFLFELIIMGLHKTYEIKKLKCKCCEFLQFTYASEDKTDEETGSSYMQIKPTDPNKNKPVNETRPNGPLHDKTIEEVKNSKYNISLLSVTSLSTSEIDIVKEKSLKLFNEAERFQENNDYENAKKSYEICLALRLRSTGQSSKDTASVLSSLAGVELRLGSYKESLDKYLKAHKIFLSVYGESHIMVGSILHNIGLCYDMMNQYDTALDYYSKALNLKLILLSRNHHSTATTYYNIAAIYDAKQRYSDAIKYFQMSTDICNNLYGEENLESASAYNNIGLIYNKLNEGENALNYLKKCRDVSNKLLGDNHPLSATCLNNLGLVYFKMNFIEEALQYFNQSVKIREKLPELGFKNQKEIASSYNNLAGVYFKKEEFENAKENYLKSLDLYLNLAGKNSQETATTYNNLGLVHAKMKNYDDALINFENALEINKNLLGEENVQTLAVLVNLTGIYFELDDYRTCVENYLKALEIYKEAYGENSTELLPIYENLGHCFSNMKKFNEAEIHYEKCLKLTLLNFGKHSSHTEAAYLNLIKLSQNKGDFEKADDYSRKFEKLKNNSS